jgi:hypothetical protein
MTGTKVLFERPGAREPDRKAAHPMLSPRPPDRSRTVSSGVTAAARATPDAPAELESCDSAPARAGLGRPVGAREARVGGDRTRADPSDT